MFSAVFRIGIRNLVLSGSFAITALSVFSQGTTAPNYNSQEVSDTDGIPVLIKHLPDWENRRDKTTFAANNADLKSALGQRPVLDLIDFSAGTEAATAPYDAGKLLIVEYASPQGSLDADAKITAKLANDDQAASTIYRRIGNYNAIVFDAPDKAAANALIDQVKYEKQVQWLGDNPFRISPERAFVLSTYDIFLSTLIIILMGIGFSIVGGIISGYVFFYIRDQKRASMPTFTDAGGMTRLNLDGFTPDIVPKGLLND